MINHFSILKSQELQSFKVLPIYMIKISPELSEEKLGHPNII